jgi:large subunit ribosomal protein L24
MMKQEWSRRWVSSVQPRKQRKYRYNAPLHVRQGFVSATLSKALRERFGKRNMALRKGDEVEVMRGSFRGQRGNIDRVDLSKAKIYVDEIKVKKSDGSEVMRALQPSNLRIIKLNLDDKKRQAVLDRAQKPAERKEKKKEEKREEPRKEKPAEKKEKIKKPTKKKEKKKEKPKAAKKVKPRKAAKPKRPRKSGSKR